MASEARERDSSVSSGGRDGSDNRAAVAPETIVVIDDDYVMRLSCRKTLQKTGYIVHCFEDGHKGLEAVAELRPDLVVVDLKMPGLSGLEVIPRVGAIDPNIVIVVITGYATVSTAIEAMKSGAYDFLPKPFSPDELRLIVARGLERRRLQLESHRLEVEREAVKRQFVTFVSHQLQTPLVAVHQYLEVLKRLGDSPTATAKRSEWMDRCLKRTDEMLSMIKDWLTLSKVESGSMVRESIAVDLQPVAHNVVDAYTELASRRGVSLESRIVDSCPVQGDRSCVAMLVDNLVVNAIKYNREGGTVTVSARCDGPEVELCVSDTGIGIPEEYRPLLFTEFFRIKGESTRGTTGTGLGLAICRRVALEMGGSIDFESEVGVGTRFLVRLPASTQGGAA